MLSQEEGENGFELVDSPKDVNNTVVSSGPTPLPLWITPTTSLSMAAPPLGLPAGQLFSSTSISISSNAPQLYSPNTVPLSSVGSLAQQVDYLIVKNTV